jgi:hypothetical protein
VLDGVYSSASPFSRPIFQRAEPLTDQDVIEVTTRLHRRILCYLFSCGRLPKAEPDEDEVQPDEPLLAERRVPPARVSQTAARSPSPARTRATTGRR